MTATAPRCEPELLAASVRLLAQDAHRLLNQPTPNSSELRSLLEQARRLRDELREWPSDGLPAWVDRVEHRLERA